MDLGPLHRRQACTREQADAAGERLGPSPLVPGHAREIEDRLLVLGLEPEQHLARLLGLRELPRVFDQHADEHAQHGHALVRPQATQMPAENGDHRVGHPRMAAQAFEHAQHFLVGRRQRERLLQHGQGLLRSPQLAAGQLGGVEQMPDLLDPSLGHTAVVGPPHQRLHGARDVPTTVHELGQRPPRRRRHRAGDFTFDAGAQPARGGLVVAERFVAEAELVGRHGAWMRGIRRPLLAQQQGLEEPGRLGEQHGVVLALSLVDQIQHLRNLVARLGLGQAGFLAEYGQEVSPAAFGRALHHLGPRHRAKRGAQHQPAFEHNQCRLDLARGGTLAGGSEQGRARVLVPSLGHCMLRDLLEEGRGLGRLAALGGNHGQGQGARDELRPARQRGLGNLLGLGKRVVVSQQELQQARGAHAIVGLKGRERAQLA